MARKPEYLPLPGISTKDPNFYDGANYADRERFAHPVNTSQMPSPNMIDIGIGKNGLGGTFGGSEEPGEAVPMAPAPSPFKIGGV